jgi:HSP20 family protein
MAERRFVNDLAGLIPGMLGIEYQLPVEDEDFPVDIIEDEKTIYVYAEIPGVNKESIKVDFYNNTLTLEIDKISPYNTVSETEIKYGKFNRSVILPVCVTRKETVSVTYNNGILKIKINKLVEEENKFSVSIQ